MNRTFAARAGELAGRYGYLALVGACGSAALAESLRIRRSYHTAEFLAGPGGYVMIIGVVLLFFALVELAAQIRRGVRGGGADGGSAAAAAAREAPAAGARRKMQLTFALCVMYVLLVKPLGFTLASLLYLAANLLLLGSSVKVTAATLAVVFVILRFGAPAIGLYLPRGVFGF